MLSIWPITWMVLPGFKLLLQVGHDLVDCRGDAAEVAALQAGIDLVDRLDVRLVGVGGHAAPFQGRHVAEQAGHRPVAARQRSGNRRVVEIVQRAHVALGCLHRDVVGNARASGSVQKLGVTCSDELSVTLRLSATVMALRPSCAARVRSMVA